MRKKEIKDYNADLIKSRIMEVILLTSYEDDDGSVWGMDTECGKMKDLVNKALSIIQHGK